MVSDPIQSDLVSVTSYMIGYDSTSAILGSIKSDPLSMILDPIGSDPISMISDLISLNLVPAAAAGIGPRSCPLAQRRFWIAIPAAPTMRGFGTGSGVARAPVGLRSLRRRVASRDPRAAARNPLRRAVPCRKSYRRPCVAVLCTLAAVHAPNPAAAYPHPRSPASVRGLNPGLSPRARGGDRDRPPAPRRAACDLSPRGHGHVLCDVRTERSELTVSNSSGGLRPRARVEVEISLSLDLSLHTYGILFLLGTVIRTCQNPV